MAVDLHEHRHHEPCQHCKQWPAWAHELLFRLFLLEVSMTELSGAETDLAAAVTAVGAALVDLEGQVATLQAAVASGDSDAITAAAADIETQVSALNGMLPVVPPPVDPSA